MTAPEINYAEKTTAELLELLLTEEDRVTLEHIQTLVARPEAIAPLVKQLSDSNFWRTAHDEQWWWLYHAFTILSLTRRNELLPTLLQGFYFANLEDFDWITEISPAAFAQFGLAAVEPLIEFITTQRQESKALWIVSSMRSYLATAVTRIALENPEARPRVADFMIGRFTDPEETDPSFLGLILGHALTLDFERAQQPIRRAFERNAIDETVSGDFADTLEWHNRSDKELNWEYSQDLLKFYEPFEIARRQMRWQTEQEAAAKAAKKQKADEIAQRLGWGADEPVTPEGYFQTNLGTVIREDVKIGRNDPCLCGSGKKYKKCCG